MKSQKLRILQMLLNSPNHRVTNRELNSHYLFHKASSRCSDLRKEGYDIRFTKCDEVMDGFYELIEDKKVEFKYEGEQAVWI